MGKVRKGMVRLRVLFDDRFSQFGDGPGRFWLLLKPSIATISDLATHIREKFALNSRFVLCVDGFALPPFEPACILKDSDIISVKLKPIKKKDAPHTCDDQSIGQDFQIVKARQLFFDNNIIKDEKSHAKLPENVSKESAVYSGNLSPDILVHRQKREHSLKIHDPGRNRKKSNRVENKAFGRVNGTSNMELNSKDDIAQEVELAAARPFSEAYLGEPSSSIPCKKRIHSDGINDSLESQTHTHSDVIKEFEQSSGLCMANSDYPAIMPGEHRIDFTSLFPLTRSPMKGDVLAYRYVEPSSMPYPILSSPMAGKVASFDLKSSEIVLTPAPEFEVFSEENPKTSILSRSALHFNEDGSLKIKLSELVDVRLLSSSIAPNTGQIPDCDNWMPTSTFLSGSGSSANHPSNERMCSTQWLYEASPAAALFWDTVLSKGAFSGGGR